MKYASTTIHFAFFIMICFCAAGMAACTNKQDDMNYRRYLNQHTKIEGKAGVLLTAIGQPEDYDFDFFDRYLTQIFHAVFPPILQPFILADRGTVLLDPKHLEASEKFKPTTLMNCYGHTKNKKGIPYTELGVEWIEPREKESPGHFLWKEKNNHIDIVEKVAIKIVASYYSKMPKKKIPYRKQHIELFKNIEKMLSKIFPDVPLQWAWSMYPETIEEAVNELIDEKVNTIVVCDFFPVYSSLEEFNSLFVEVKDIVAERAKLIFTPYPGAYKSYRKAFVRMAEDEILGLPEKQKKLLVLTRHGFPDIPGDPYLKLARVFYWNLKDEIEQALHQTNTHVIFADTDFAGESMDPEEKRLASFEALAMGLEEEYDHIIFILVDFLSENTDSIFAMRLETFEPLHFTYEDMVPYHDFSKPYRTELKHGKTRIVVAGTPVGQRYRPFISRGIFDAIATILQEKTWPPLILKEEEKKEALF